MSTDGGWYTTEKRDGTLVLSFGGIWEIATLADLDIAMRNLSPGVATAATLDLSGLDRIDTAGVWVVLRTGYQLENAGLAVTIEGMDPTFKPIFDRIAESQSERALEFKPSPRWLLVINQAGKATVEALQEGADLLAFLGESIVTAGRVVVRPQRIRFVSFVSHLEQVGFNALPIVGLLSFLIGVVLAYQGADQLRKFGAEIFTVNLLGVAILREMGIVLTSVIVAGRSGSAFTAHIGTMQVNEEVDAMRTIGMDPIEVLVLPRVLALIVAMPLLTVFANFMGLLGGGLMSLLVLDISILQFVERLRTVVPLWSFWVGVIKAPFFGALIAIVGCREGLNVAGSAESVGRQTTKSVVVSIFLVIVADALFSIFFSLVGV